MYKTIQTTTMKRLDLFFFFFLVFVSFATFQFSFKWLHCPSIQHTWIALGYSEHATEWHHQTALITFSVIVYHAPLKPCYLAQIHNYFLDIQIYQNDFYLFCMDRRFYRSTKSYYLFCLWNSLFSHVMDGWFPADKDLGLSRVSSCRHCSIFNKSTCTAAVQSNVFWRLATITIRLFQLPD